MDTPSLTPPTNVRLVSRHFVSEWCLDVDEPDTLHRLDGPAEVWVHETTGQVSRERWHLYGVLHRDKGPAILDRTIHGQVVRMAWLEHGVEHRVDGPALVDVSNPMAPTLLLVWKLDGQNTWPDGPSLATAQGMVQWSEGLVSVEGPPKTNRPGTPAR